MISSHERAFLEMLAARKQGRASYALVRRDDAMGIAGGLVERGYVRERRLGYDEGFQITELGKAYLGGMND